MATMSLWELSVFSNLEILNSYIRHIPNLISTYSMYLTTFLYIHVNIVILQNFIAKDIVFEIMYSQFLKMVKINFLQ